MVLKYYIKFLVKEFVVGIGMEYDLLLVCLFNFLFC